MTEGDPTQNIIDAETFSYFVIGYITEVKEKAPEQADRLRKTHTKLIKALFPDHEGEVSPDVKLVGIPWLEVPESIQGVLSQQCLLRKYTWEVDYVNT